MKIEPNHELLAFFMLETLKLSKTLKSSRDDFNVLDNFNVSSIKTAVVATILPRNSRRSEIMTPSWFINFCL